MRILAIDQGTTSTRALVVEDGRIELMHAVEHAQNYPAPGRVEHDPLELLRNVRACLAAAGPVDAIGIDNQGESCLGWHAETGEPVSPVIVWQDSRTAEITEALKAEGVEALTQKVAGLPLDPYFSASKLAWILHNVPCAAELARAGKLRLGTTDAFFLQHLTGRCATDVTTASRTSLMTLERGQWNEALCRLFGVPIETLPPIRATVDTFGTVEMKGRQIPVTASVVDQQAALYGHGCRAPGDAKITFGTGAFVLALTGEVPIRSASEGFLPTVAWRIGAAPSQFAIDGGIYNASSAVDWARSLGLFQGFDDISRFQGPPAIERDLVFVPALSGLACPHWDRSAAGLWLGLSLDTTRFDMVRAVLEGVALRAAEVVAAMASHIALKDRVSIDGGMARNPYFCQFLADALGRQITVPATAEITALGCAMLAGRSSLDHILAEGGSYDPAGPQRQRWSERFADAVSRSRSWRGPVR